MSAPQPIMATQKRLDDANLVGDVQGVVVSGQAHVRLLLAIGPAWAVRKCVHSVRRQHGKHTPELSAHACAAVRHRSVLPPPTTHTHVCLPVQAALVPEPQTFVRILPTGTCPATS